MNLPGLPIFVNQVIAIDEKLSNELLYPYNSPFFSFPFILISEFGVIQSWSQIPREDFANTQAPYRPTYKYCRPRRFITDAGISCSTNTWNVAALCYSVFVVQFVPQERLMCNCICMITRLCMQSQTNTFESYRLIKQHPRMYVHVHAGTASVSNFRCASSTRAKRKVTTGRSKITTNKMSLLFLSLPFYLDCSNLLSLQITLNYWYK